MDYKSICVLGYIFAALGSIVFSAKHYGWTQFEPNEILYHAYFIGGLLTLWCAYNWVMKKERTVLV